MKARRAEVEPGWPDSLYLIGCLAPAGCAPAEYQPSVQTMGFKAYNLLRMASMGLPVPPAFAIGTIYCHDDESSSRASRPAVWRPGLQALERATRLCFGDARLPLLLSVRSGAPVSMPGMMETLLNIGLCETTLPGFLRQTGNPGWCGIPTVVWSPATAKSWPACRHRYSMPSAQRSSARATNANSTSPSCGR